MPDARVVLLDFRALLEAAPDGIAVVDPDGRILVANERLCEIFGYEAKELLSNRIRTLIPERLRDLHAEHRRRYFDQPTKRPMGISLPLVGVRKDGTEFPVEISLSPITSGDQTFAIAAVRDISDQKRLREQEASLRATLDIEQERHRIGMDLHDGIMQDIYAVTLALDMAFEDIEAPAQAKEGVGRSIDQLQGVIRDIRSYIFELRPRQFAGDVRQALIDLGREFQENSAILTDVDVGPLPKLHPDIGVALYVIAHEALSNTRKYAEAQQAWISLAANSAGVEMEIRDDGRGFDASAGLSEGHRGLRNMASRASIIGAELQIESAPGMGTVIRVSARLD
jgi:PAS domain S-box-containing protein